MRLKHACAAMALLLLIGLPFYLLFRLLRRRGRGKPQPPAIDAEADEIAKPLLGKPLTEFLFGPIWGSISDRVFGLANEVARVVGRANRRLGDARILLLGPGRWGTTTPALERRTSGKYRTGPLSSQPSRNSSLAASAATITPANVNTDSVQAIVRWTAGTPRNASDHRNISTKAVPSSSVSVTNTMAASASPDRPYRFDGTCTRNMSPTRIGRIRFSIIAATYTPNKSPTGGAVSMCCNARRQRNALAKHAATYRGNASRT